jgi:hypothetical protein
MRKVPLLPGATPGEFAPLARENALFDIRGAKFSTFAGTDPGDPQRAGIFRF